MITFPEQFELCFTSNIREIIKLYNLGNKIFETDFRIDLKVLFYVYQTWCGSPSTTGVQGSLFPQTNLSRYMN